MQGSLKAELFLTIQAVLKILGMLQDATPSEKKSTTACHWVSVLKVTALYHVLS